MTLLGGYSAEADINGVSGCKEINVKVTLGSEIVPMQLDIEASVSIIQGGIYKDVMSIYPLQASNITLKAYIGDEDAIPIAGKVYIPVAYRKQRFTLTLVVACGERQRLLGRDCLQEIKLDW